MIISWNWLNRYVDLSDLDPSEVAKRFTITTAEIEEVILPPSKEFLSQFEVVEVIEVIPHPNADKLRCCKVKQSSGILDIVCGAPNVRVGLKTILAPIGTKLGDFVIKKAKLRGEPSEGMLCSEKEIGAGEDGSGIIELSNSAEVGKRASDIFTNLPTLWDLDNKAITHRPDLWGHYGIARELAAIYKRPFKNLSFELKKENIGNNGFSVKIDDSNASRRYCGLSLSNLNVNASPKWIQDLLKEVGLSPINNIVDATNFVMMEMGQPCHAFDIAKLPSKEIKVTFAKKEGTQFKTLTEKELELKSTNLVICSGETPVALAGVMGGDNSAINENTTDVFLEAAHFESLGIRKTAQQHDLRTDSSSRFEKSLDPENAYKAVVRLNQLLKESCPESKVTSDLIDVYPAPISVLEINLNPTYVSKKLGLEIARHDQIEILERLNFEVRSDKDTLIVKVPSFRNTKDIEGSIDLVEEIGRIHGYEKIIPTGPMVKLEPVKNSEEQDLMETLQNQLTYKGYNEVITYSFTNTREMEALGLDSGDALKLKNSVNKDQTHMRTTLLSRIFEVCKLNAKNLNTFKLFECGKVFKKTKELLPEEIDELVCVNYGKSNNGELFYELKGTICNLLENMGIYGTEVEVAKNPQKAFHPVRTASLKLNGVEIGLIGELNPAFSKKLGLKERLNMAILYQPLKIKTNPKTKFTSLQKYPIVQFSLSLIVEERTNTGDVLKTIQSVDENIIQDLRWVENFKGDSIPEGKVSMTLDMNFVRNDRTMAGKEIDELQKNIVEKAAQAGYHLRAK